MIKNDRNEQEGRGEFHAQSTNMQETFAIYPFRKMRGVRKTEDARKKNTSSNITGVAFAAAFTDKKKRKKKKRTRNKRK